MLDTTTAITKPDLKGQFVYEIEKYVSADGILNSFWTIGPPRRSGAGILFERWVSSAESTYVSGRYRVKRRAGKRRAFDVVWLGKNNRPTPMTEGDAYDQLIEIASQIEKMGRF